MRLGHNEQLLPVRIHTFSVQQKLLTYARMVLYLERPFVRHLVKQCKKGEVVWALVKVCVQVRRVFEELPPFYNKPVLEATSVVRTDYWQQLPLLVPVVTVVAERAWVQWDVVGQVNSRPTVQECIEYVVSKDTQTVEFSVQQEHFYYFDARVYQLLHRDHECKRQQPYRVLQLDLHFVKKFELRINPRDVQ